MVRPTLCVLIVALAACNPDGPASPEPSAGVQADPAPKTSPTLGISRIQSQHDEIKELIAESKAKLEAGEKVPAWLLKNQLTMVDHLITACERGIREEARQAVRHSHAMLRPRERDLRKAQAELYVEISEIDRILADKERGVGKIPTGFTEAELRDQRGDHLLRARQIDKEIEEVHEEMRKLYKLLEQDVVPPQGDTLLTRERAALAKTRAEIAALQP